jgi:hypothetical protein
MSIISDKLLTEVQTLEDKRLNKKTEYVRNIHRHYGGDTKGPAAYDTYKVYTKKKIYGAGFSKTNRGLL